MSGYQHGAHYPERGGYYDAGLKGFVETPTRTVRARAPRPKLDGFRDTVRSTSESIAEVGAAWKADALVEQLRRLRDTNPAGYAKMSPANKMAVGAYENQLRSFIDQGGELPDGVAPPPAPPPKL